MKPPEGADVVSISIGSRTYVADKGGVWSIESVDADDLRRAGWQDVSSANAAKAINVASATPEA
jgi:hypothetical protein